MHIYSKSLRSTSSFAILFTKEVDIFRKEIVFSRGKSHSYKTPLEKMASILQCILTSKIKGHLERLNKFYKMIFQHEKFHRRG